MALYIMRRILYGLVLLAGATACIYFLLSLVPGGPLEDLYVERPVHRISLGEIHRLGQTWGVLNAQNHPLPWYARYFTWLFSPDRPGLDVRLGPVHLAGGGILTGDWGTSTFVSPGRPVLRLIGHFFPYTLILILMSSALVLSVMLAIPVGVVAAVKQYSKLDFVLSLGSFVGASVPTFWVGWMLLALFSFQLSNWGWPHLPPGGAYSGAAQDALGDPCGTWCCLS